MQLTFILFKVMKIFVMVLVTLVKFCTLSEKHKIIN